MTREDYADLLLPNVKHDYNYYEEPIDKQKEKSF